MILQALLYASLIINVVLIYILVNSPKDHKVPVAHIDDLATLIQETQTVVNKEFVTIRDKENHVVCRVHPDSAQAKFARENSEYTVE
jgi:hypothetical protein